MTSPADITIRNQLEVPLKTRVTRDYWVEGDGKSIDGQVIPANGIGIFRVSAKTGHHGELDIELIRDDQHKLVLGSISIKSIKDPQEGGALITTVASNDGWVDGGLQIASFGERRSPNDKDLRRIAFTLLRAEYATMHYNEVSMKSSHNSYERDERVVDQLLWDTFPGQNFQRGCGSVEIDIAQSEDGNDWSVGHTGTYDRKYRQLSQFLSDLTAYSKEHAQHDVITLHLDLKKVRTDDFPAKLDEYIRTRLLIPIYSPKDLMGTYATLPEGARHNGWPTIKDLAGKILVCLTGNGDAKKKYAGTAPSSRLCFADKDCQPEESPSDDHRVFFNYEVGHSHRDQWMNTFRVAASRKDVVLRAYVVNSEGDWLDCLESGCNLIATNKIMDHSWAAVGKQRFVKRTPLV